MALSSAVRQVTDLASLEFNFHLFPLSVEHQKLLRCWKIPDMNPTPFFSLIPSCPQWGSWGWCSGTPGAHCAIPQIPSAAGAPKLELRGKEHPQPHPAPCMWQQQGALVCQSCYTAQALGAQPRDQNVNGSLATATGGGWQLRDGAFPGLQPCSAFMLYFLFAGLRPVLCFSFISLQWIQWIPLLC